MVEYSDLSWLLRQFMLRMCPPQVVGAPLYRKPQVPSVYFAFKRVSGWQMEFELGF